MLRAMTHLLCLAPFIPPETTPMHILSAMLLGVTAKGLYGYIPEEAKDKIYLKMVDFLITVREFTGCKRCRGRSVAVTSRWNDHRVMTSYVYTDDNAIVHPKYSIIRYQEMVPFSEIDELCDQIELYEMYLDDTPTYKGFGATMAVVFVNETVVVPIQELFNSLAGPTQDFRHNSEVTLKEALLFVDDSKMPTTDCFCLLMYMADGSEWKVTDLLNTKLVDLLNPKECDTAIAV
jgi:hypothetical protein